MIKQVNLHFDNCKYSNFYTNHISNSTCIEFAVIDLKKHISFDEYFAKGLNSMKRHDYRRSVNRGYESKPITWEERNTLLDDIYEINTSKDERQGRPMAERYSKKPNPVNPESMCKNHYPEFYGCFKDKKLVSYIVTYNIGTMSILSQFLGHWDYLKDCIIVNNLIEVIKKSFERNYEIVVYYYWISGTENLTFFKRTMGFEPTYLEIIR